MKYTTARSICQEKHCEVFVRILRVRFFVYLSGTNFSSRQMQNHAIVAWFCDLLNLYFKILKHFFEPVLCGKAGVGEIAFFSAPLFQTAVVIHFQIV